MVQSASGGRKVAEPGRAELEDRALAWLIVERGLADQAAVEPLIASADRRRLLTRIPGTNVLAALARERVRSCERCGQGVVVEAGPWTLRCSGCGASPGSASETVAIASPAAADAIETASAAPGVVPGNAPAAPARGDRIAGYVVERELGRGAMGVVVLARRAGEAPVALKLMSRGTDELQQRFLREGRVMARLRHPNVVSVREVGEVSGVPWIAMEYVEGTPLSSLGKKGLSLDDALAIAEGIARALDHAHANGLVHRDLKPANVLVTDEGVPKVVDFGLAKDLMTASALTREGSLLGTPHYMAPEAVKGAEKVTGAADIYALGAILYELATRTLPFESEARLGLKAMVKAIAEGGIEPPSRRRPDLGLSADFDAVVLRALDRRVEVRYPSALAFAEDMARLRRGEPLARPGPADPKPPRPGARFGDFEALEVVGRGGSGVVHRGRGPRGETVAIKVLQDENAGARARFAREQRILGLLGEAEGFVPLLATGETERGAYVVMPFVGGGTLRDRIGRGMGVEDALATMRSIARAMGRAHERGVVHRDLKPDNVLFTEKGVPLVADLGLAKHVADGPGASRSVALTSSGEFRGTAGYMPLEQMYDVKNVTPASDVFALGVMAYECLAGDRPFKGSSVLEIVSNVEHERFEPLDRLRRDTPPWAVAAITRCLARDPEKRFPDAGAFARALEEPSRKDGSRRLVAAVLVLGGFALAFALGRGTRSTRSDGGAPVTSAQAVVSSPSATYVPLPYRSVVATRRTRLAGIWGSPDGKHGAETLSVVAARDGRHILSGSVDRTVKLWELVPASPGSKEVRIREVLSLSGHAGSVMAVALPGEREPLHAISASLDGTLKLWDLARGVASATLADGTGELNAVALSTDGERAVAGGADGILRLWDLPGRAVIRRLDAHGGAIHSVALSADRARALSGHADGRVRVWDLAREDGEPTLVLEGDDGGAVGGIALTADGTRAASCGQSLHVWDTRDGHEIERVNGDVAGASFPCLDLTPDGTRVIFAGSDGTVHVCAAEAAHEERAHPNPSKGIWSIAALPSGDAYVTAGRDGTLRLVDLATGRELSRTEGHTGRILALAVSRDGRRVTSAGSDGLALVRDAVTGSELARIDAGSPVNAASASPDGRLLALACEDGRLHVFDAGTGASVAALLLGAETPAPPARSGLDAATFLSDSKRVLVGDASGTVSLCDLEGPAPLWTVKAHSSAVTASALLPDGKTAVTGSRDGALLLWDLASGRATSLDSVANAGAVQVATSGRALAVSGQPGKLLVLDLAAPRSAEGKPPWRELEGHEGATLSVALSPDGRLLASSAMDGTVRLWDLARGVEVDRIAPGGFEPSFALAFAGRESLLVGTVRGVVLRFELVDGPH